jgi:hypothetical protein
MKSAQSSCTCTARRMGVGRVRAQRQLA